MRIGFIGTGAMAQAIARGAVASGVDPATLVFSNRTAAKACELADELGATAASSNTSLDSPYLRPARANVSIIWKYQAGEHEARAWNTGK